jgi:hypothetical protein
MARRSWQDKREPQAACSGSKVASIVRAIGALQTKQVRLAKQKFELGELMHLFVEPEHHEHLTYTYRLVEPTGAMCNLHVKADVPPHLEQHASGPCFMKFTWWGKQDGGFHVPHDRGAEEGKWAYVLRQHAQADFVEKYVQVEQDLLDIQCRFALVERVFRNLNSRNVCATLPQMRYVWPCITVLLAKAGFHEDAKAVAEPSLRAGDKTNVPDWLSKLLKETNDTVVRSLMLDDVPMPNEPDKPSYDLHDTFKTH